MNIKKLQKGKSVRIPIVISSDNKIFFSVGVVLTSLLENAAPDTFYEVNVLYTADVSEDNKNTLKLLQHKYKNMSLNMQDMGNKFCDIKVTEGYHVNYVSAYKMLIPELFPQYDKIIYLDTDVLVREDLQQFYQIDIKDFYIGGTPVLGNCIGNSEKYIEMLDIPDMDYYINAGIMLMNLQKIRADNISEKWLALLGKYENSVDQHIINKICYGKTLMIPKKYNVCLSELKYYQSMQIYAYYSPQEVREAFENPAIYHWTGEQKPWIYNDTFLAQEWFYYFNLSPFKCTLKRKKCHILSPIEEPQTNKYTIYRAMHYILGLPLFRTKNNYKGTKVYLFGFIPLYLKKNKPPEF
jgi:lipopolysaccharide biosynthesis glycosyltransferase